ncbi:MAG: organomercurial lyase [Nitrospinota bacterium]
MSAANMPDPPAGGAPGKRATVSLRPGLSFPNWAAVTSDTARQALEAIVAVMGIETRWSDLGDAEDRVRRAVLDLYARLGHAPTLSQLAGATGLTTEEVRAQLGKLKTRDIVVLDDKGEAIVGAYPLSERETGHRVHLGEHVLNAMCAIDALGVGAMYQSDVGIESSCLRCGADIGVATREKGSALETVSPASTVVWSGIQYEDKAATSLCTVLAFFCCDDHLQAWRAENPDAKGYRLSPDKGLQVGRAIFMNLLNPPSPGR